MARIDSASEVKKEKNRAGYKVTRLRKGDSLGMAQSGGKNMAGEVADGGGADEVGLMNPLVALAKANDIVVWFLHQVVLPLSVLFGVPVLVFCLIMKIEGAFWHFVGDGFLLTFGGLLLIGVFGAISRARFFAQCYHEDIGLRRWAAILLILGIVLLFLYAVNFFAVNLCELVPKMDPKLFGGLKKWTYVGIAGGAAAIFFSFAAIFCMIRALYSCAQGGGSPQGEIYECS